MISGVITAVLLVCFIGITVWAWSARNRERFGDAAQLPLRDEPAAREAAEAGECCGCGGAKGRCA